MMRIRDWLQPLLRTWGAQRRRVITGKRDAKHEDGWSPVSVTAAMAEGGITGGSGHARQHFPEVYSEAVYPVWLAWHHCPIEVRESLHLEYVVIIPRPKKFMVMGVDRETYDERLKAAEHYIGGVIRGLAGERVPELGSKQQSMGDLIGVHQATISRAEARGDTRHRKIAEVYLDGWQRGACIKLQAPDRPRINLI